MHCRLSLLDIFSTFIEFRADRFNRWVIDHRLRRNFAWHQANLSELDLAEDFWVLYWYTRWKKQSDDLALAHLSAYLQETCYWAAQRAIRVLSNTSYCLSDCFQLVSVETEKVLAGYDLRRGVALNAYARIAYGSLIRDALRQRQEADICTVWTLLRRVGKQRLVASLRQVGLSKTVIAQYQLAWLCYKTLCGFAKVPTRKLRQPSQEEWSAIASLYNTERLNQLSEPGPILTPEMLEQRLTQCAAWVREYMYPSVRSLNAPSRNGDELQDDLPDPLLSSLMTSIIEAEDMQQRQIQQAQISGTLIEAISQLATDNQAILSLYYRDQLTQVEIAQQLNLKQYTVSRRLTRVRETLLSALTDWAQTMHISLSPDLIVSMSAALEEWLTVHYHNQT